MALSDLLRSLITSDDPNGGSTPENPTDVEGVVVTPTKKPKPEMLAPVSVDTNPQLGPALGNPQLTPPVPPAPPIPQASMASPFNYNNSNAQTDVQAAVDGLRPQGGSANPGIYGLLPEKMQHGTLRNVLGAIGDAFLVQSGNEATYGPRMDRQRVGLAMAGLDPDDPASVQAAIQRIAATGAPDSLALADKMQKDFNDAALRKQTQESNDIYKQQQTASRQDASIQRLIPYVGGMVRGATTKEAYKAAFQRAEAMAQRIDPQYHATDFGLIDPEDWTPEAALAAGLTSKDMLASGDKAAGRKTTERGQDVGARSRIQAASIGAGSRVQAARIGASRPTAASILDDLTEKQNNGETLTPAEQSVFNKMTILPSKRSRGALPAGVTIRGGAKPPVAASGRVVTNGDVKYLKANPGARAQFEVYFGKGSAKKYLGY